MTRHISNAIADPYFSFHKLFEFKGLNNIPNITFGYSDSEYFQKGVAFPSTALTRSAAVGNWI